MIRSAWAPSIIALILVLADHFVTICDCSYGNMALFYHGLNQTELALRHMSRALLLLGLSSDPDHPDVAATFINVAMMYQDIGKMDTALRFDHTTSISSPPSYATALSLPKLHLDATALYPQELSERPNGYLFNRMPPPQGQSRKWEDWELTCYVTSFLTIVILGLGLNATPDHTLETWAHQEAIRQNALQLEEKEKRIVS
nr:clustered mitochondria protein-like [Ipomoea trifida]